MTTFPSQKMKLMITDLPGTMDTLENTNEKSMSHSQLIIMTNLLYDQRSLGQTSNPASNESSNAHSQEGPTRSSDKNLSSTFEIISLSLAYVPTCDMLLVCDFEILANSTNDNVPRREKGSGRHTRLISRR